MLRAPTILFGMILLALHAPLFAEDAPAVSVTQLEQEAAATDRLAASRGETQVSQRMIDEFAVWAGSPANAKSLVEGLRNAGTIELRTRSADGVDMARIGPITKPMGFGNVFITLALVQAELKKAGVSAPNADQLRAALTGDRTTIDNKTVGLAGVLTMHAQGAGWGEIAKVLGLNLGEVVSRLRSENGRLEAAAHDGKGDDSGQGRGADERHANTERTEKAERAERPEKPEKFDRPEMDRPLRTERSR
jgi:hypothetical protein